SVAFFQPSDMTFANVMTTLHPVWPAFDAANNAAPGAVVGPPVYIDPNAARPSRQYQWSIGVQRELGRNLVVEATYVANRVVWLSTVNGGITSPGSLAPFNALTPQLLAKYGFTDFNNANDAALLNATISSLTPAQKDTLAARGVNLL